MNKKGSNPQPPEPPKLRELWEGSEAPVKPEWSDVDALREANKSPVKPKIKVMWEGSTIPVRPKAKAGQIIVEGYPLNFYINARVLLAFITGCAVTVLYFIS